MKIVEICSSALKLKLNEGQRITHLEDLIVDNGYAGVVEALKIVKNIIDKKSDISIKFDGRPALIFGRNAKGKFILTDKTGFTAKTYNGLPETLNDLSTMLNNRGPGRESLVKTLIKLWPIIESSIPKNFRGFVQGDLLYSSKPKLVNDNFVFTPNITTYNINKDSDLGKLIAKSSVGLAIHTFFNEPGSEPIGLPKNLVLKNIGSLLLFPVNLNQKSKLKSIDKTSLLDILETAQTNKQQINQTINLKNITSYGIAKEFIPFFKKFFNHNVRLGNFNKLTTEYLDKKVDDEKFSDSKKDQIKKYIHDNQHGIESIFFVFKQLTEVKEKLIQELDEFHNDIKANVFDIPGGEGYVVRQDNTTTKLVNRLNFSRKNFSVNNPSLI